jgi:hypothetical protein
MAITVSLQDVKDAEDFLAEFASDKIVDGDYTDGSSLRDLAIKSVAYTFALLRKTDEQIRARQSLKKITEIDVSDDAEAADDAADEILSNWFAARHRGTFARVSAYGHASERVDIDIAAQTRFYKSSSLTFLLDNNTEDLHIPAEDLVAQFDSDGVVIDYTFRIPLVASATGLSYNIPPGRFSGFDSFNAYVTYIETLEEGIGGDDIESTPDVVDRSTNLITVRNLINARSCDAVLRDLYGEIRALTVIGMGDNEMIRDRIREAATGLELHVGGHQDIYVDLPVIETSFTGVVGAKFARPDNIINVFRDPTYVDGTLVTFPGLGVLPGMVLRVWEGLPTEARDFAIREVRDAELYVSERVPFPVATDEETPPGVVTWSVGALMPDFEDVITAQTTGETSRQVQNTGRIVLPGGPLYHIKDVTINDPSDPDADPSDNLVHLNVRVNSAPQPQVAPDNEYQVVVHNPENHQSLMSYADVLVGPTGNLGKYDTKSCKVTYDTLGSFSSIAGYVVERRQRISAENPIVKGFHPAYLMCTIEYRLKKSATTTVDATEAAAALVTFINNFPSTEVLDVSTLSDFLKETYPDIGHVYPFVITYDVHVPDGRVVRFETSEAVTVPSNSTQLDELQLNPGDAVDGLDNPLDYGLTDDVIRYLALADSIAVVERAA